MARHSELEQSETKAQAALLTILSLTQITELKLLLDIGRLGHRFYDFVLTLLIACILLELCVGIIIIYIGNLHYYQSATGVDVLCGCCYCCLGGGGGGLGDCLLCCCRRCRLPRSASGSSASKRHGNYLSVQTGASRGAAGAGDGNARLQQEGGEDPNDDWTAAPHSGRRYGSDDGHVAASKRHGNYLSVQTGASRGAAGAGDGNAPLQQEGGGEPDDDWTAGGSRPARRYESEGGVLDRADTGIESARVKLASAEVRIVRAANYARVVEDALRRTPGNAELEEELGRSRDELAAARRDKDELEAEQRLAEALQRRAFYAKEQREDRRERATFGRISTWQHAATYLLYFVMLMNVFITTFGISGGRDDTVIGNPPLRPEVDPTASGSGDHVVAGLTSSSSTVPTSTTMWYDAAAGKYSVILSDHSSIGNASYKTD